MTDGLWKLNLAHCMYHVQVRHYNFPLLRLDLVEQSSVLMYPAYSERSASPTSRWCMYWDSCLWSGLLSRALWFPKPTGSRSSHRVAFLLMVLRSSKWW